MPRGGLAARPRRAPVIGTAREERRDFGVPNRWRVRFRRSALVTTTRLEGLAGDLLRHVRAFGGKLVLVGDPSPRRAVHRFRGDRFLSASGPSRWANSRAFSSRRRSFSGPAPGAWGACAYRSRIATSAALSLRLR